MGLNLEVGIKMNLYLAKDQIVMPTSSDFKNEPINFFAKLSFNLNYNLVESWVSINFIFNTHPTTHPPTQPPTQPPPQEKSKKANSK